MRNILSIIQNRLFQHSLFWIFSVYIILKITIQGGEILAIDLIYCLLFHPAMILAVYTNLYSLVPGLLPTKRYLLYALAFFALAIGAAFLNLFIVNQLGQLIFPGYYFISELSLLQLIQLTSIYLITSSLLKASKSWFHLQEKEKQIQILQKEKVSLELNALKAQINPHFLFNSLNNIYSLTIDEDKKAPDFLLRLSKCLQYMIYDCQAKYVPLSAEIEYLKDYISLQKLRLSEPERIQFNIEGKSENHQIAPLLLIPIFENGFKHGVKGETNSSFLDIKLQLKNGSLRLVSTNNIGQSDELFQDQKSGLGLSNLKQQLKLLYPNKHNLSIKENEKHFSIELNLNLV